MKRFSSYIWRAEKAEDESLDLASKVQKLASPRLTSQLDFSPLTGKALRLGIEIVSGLKNFEIPDSAALLTFLKDDPEASAVQEACAAEDGRRSL